MVLGDSILRKTTFQDIAIAAFYSIIGVILALLILGIALTTAAFTQIEFPTGNDGTYGFLMKSVQSRVPLANSGGGTVSPPAYNPQYQTFGVDTGAPIDPMFYYKSTVPFSTSKWCSRLISQNSPTSYTPSMPFTYTGPFNLYRSLAVPSFGISVARPYSYGSASIPASEVCGQSATNLVSISANLTDAIPTFFCAPILWNITASRPYILGTEMTYTAREAGNMSIEMTYQTTTGESIARIILSQIVPYVVITLSPGTSISLNTYYRDFGGYSVIDLVNTMASSPPPITTPNATLMEFRTIPLAMWVGGQPPIGQSLNSTVQFSLKLSVPSTVNQLTDNQVIITADGDPVNSTTLTILPTRYYISSPKSTDPGSPLDWIFFDTVVAATILDANPIQALKSFVSSTSRNGVCTLTYSTDSGQPLIFIPSLSMFAVGSMAGAAPIPGIPGQTYTNYWLSPQGATQCYIATTGRLDVSYPLVDLPSFGTFDIYSAFDANSLKRLSYIFNRDLEALYAIDIQNDSFYTSVRKIFTFAQMTYAVFNYPASLIVNALLPSLRNHLMETFDALVVTNRDSVRLGFSPTLFTIATGDPQYGSCQNQVFGDNHVGQYGMMLFTYYIIVSIQFDNTARRYARDRYQSIMIDLMRDFAQPYATDQYIPSMRHFDFGTGISWQTSSIIEASSLQVSEVLNGYYACWLVSSLFGDTKLRDFYRGILSVELATHQEYRLACLTPSVPVQPNSSVIWQMISAAGALYENCSVTELQTATPSFYQAQGGTIVYLIQAGQLVKHSIRTNHPNYRYLVEFNNPNTVADHSTIVFYRPMSPLTVGIVPLTLGITLNSFQDVSFQLAAANTEHPSTITDPLASPNIIAYNLTTRLSVQLLTQQENPSSFMTIQAAYSLSQYAQAYVTTYTWAGANLPDGICAIIPASDLPDYLAPVVQYNKLGIQDSNTVLWIVYVITAYGPR